MAVRNVIALLGYPVLNEDRKAAEAITPGHMVSVDANGDLVKHASAGGPGGSFALERDEMGKNIDVPYAVDDQVKVGTFSPGMRVYALVPSGQNLTPDDLLKSNGAGLLVTHGGTGTAVARALEPLVSTAQTRLRVEIV